MGGVEVSGKGGRSVNSDINMVPFIDLLMVTIAFLLITAVWVSYSRVEANAQLPGPATDDEIDIHNVEPTLHVYAHESRFVLTWKQGATVISETELPRVVPQGDCPVDHSQLAAKITEEFKRHGQHQDPSDRKRDRALLHSENQLPFRELVAVMDAINTTRRPMQLRQGELKQVPAFGIGFAAR